MTIPVGLLAALVIAGGALAGMGAQDWTPQYSYWKRPEVLDDGGEYVVALTSLH